MEENNDCTHWALIAVVFGIFMFLSPLTCFIIVVLMAIFWPMLKSNN